MRDEEDGVEEEEDEEKEMTKVRDTMEVSMRQ